MSDFSTAKQDILEWARRPGAMKKFTTHDVYDAIHSIEESTIASDALRSLCNHDNLLERESFMDGNKKKFVYWLKEANPEDIIISNEDKTIISDIQVTENCSVSKGIAFSPNNTQYKHFGGIINSGSMQGITGTEPDNKTQKQSNQQIEIPSNFVIELKTPNGFTITIRGGNENTN